MLNKNTNWPSPILVIIWVFLDCFEQKTKNKQKKQNTEPFWVDKLESGLFI